MGSPGRVKGQPKAALIGGGFIGPVHAEALRRIGVGVAGVLGSTPTRARSTAEHLGIDRVYADLDDLLGEDIDVVHVASPNRHHFDQVRRVLESGRHVVCEKPLATTAAEASALVALAGERPGLVAAVNYNVRFYPLCHEMRARVERGDLGRVLSVTGSYTQDWLLEPTDYNWRVEADGGTNLRAVADIGTHWMDLAQFVVGQPIRSVFAELATFHPERMRPAGPAETFRLPGGPSPTVSVPVTTEDYGAILLRLGDDVRGAFHVSQVHAGRKNRLAIEVAGTEGALTWDSESPNRLGIGRRGRPNECLERDPSLLAPVSAAISRYPGGHAEGFPDTFAQLFLAVYSAIADPGGGHASAAYPTIADGHREVLLCEAIARRRPPRGMGAALTGLDRGACRGPPVSVR